MEHQAITKKGPSSVTRRLVRDIKELDLGTHPNTYTRAVTIHNDLLGLRQEIPVDSDTIQRWKKVYGTECAIAALKKIEDEPIAFDEDVIDETQPQQSRGEEQNVAYSASEIEGHHLFEEEEPYFSQTFEDQGSDEKHMEVDGDYNEEERHSINRHSDEEDSYHPSDEEVALDSTLDNGPDVRPLIDDEVQHSHRRPEDQGLITELVTFLGQVDDSKKPYKKRQAEAVLDALSGKNHEEIAKNRKISKGSLSKWISDLRKNGIRKARLNLYGKASNLDRMIINADTNLKYKNVLEVQLRKIKQSNGEDSRTLERAKAVLEVLKGKTPGSVAKETEYDSSSIKRWVKAYKSKQDKGGKGLAELRKLNHRRLPRSKKGKPDQYEDVASKLLEKIGGNQGTPQWPPLMSQALKD